MEWSALTSRLFRAPVLALCLVLLATLSTLIYFYHLRRVPRPLPTPRVKALVVPPVEVAASAPDTAPSTADAAVGFTWFAQPVADLISTALFLVLCFFGGYLVWLYLKALFRGPETPVWVHRVEQKLKKDAQERIEHAERLRRNADLLKQQARLRAEWAKEFAKNAWNAESAGGAAPKFGANRPGRGLEQDGHSSGIRLREPDEAFFKERQPDEAFLCALHEFKKRDRSPNAFRSYNTGAASCGRPQQPIELVQSEWEWQESVPELPAPDPTGWEDDLEAPTYRDTVLEGQVILKEGTVNFRVETFAAAGKDWTVFYEAGENFVTRGEDLELTWLQKLPQIRSPWLFVHSPSNTHLYGRADEALRHRWFSRLS